MKIMKKMILMSLLLLPFLIFAQTKKTNQETVSKSFTPISQEDKIKINAEKWFKDVYVEKVFKDPYSYKLLKLTSERITKGQDLTDSISFLTSEIEKCKLSENERNPESRQKYQEGYDKIISEMKKDEDRLKTETQESQIEYLNKRNAIQKKYALLYLNGLQEYDLYVLNTDEKKRIQNKIASLTPEQADLLAYYRIKIDCYSKNSLGNEVLGRFQFPFTEKGTISGDGISTVVQLNKE